MNQSFLFPTDAPPGAFGPSRPRDAEDVRLEAVVAEEHALMAIEDAAIGPRDPNVVEAEKPRLTGQNAAILAALEAAGGTGVSNRTLAGISLKYTSRISDLRAAGHQVECFARDRATGECRYRLRSK